MSGTRASVAHCLTPCSKQGEGKTASFQEVPGTRASVVHWLTTRGKQGTGNFLVSLVRRLLYIPWKSVLFIFLCVCFAFSCVKSRLSEHTGPRLHLSLRVGREALEMVFHASFADFPSAVSSALFHIFVDMSFPAEAMIAPESPPTAKRFS